MVLNDILPIVEKYLDYISKNIEGLFILGFIFAILYMFFEFLKIFTK